MERSFKYNRIKEQRTELTIRNVRLVVINNKGKDSDII